MIWRQVIVKIKNNKAKKFTLIALSVLCAFTSATAISAGAKTTQYKHTVSIGGYSGGNDTTWISINKNNKSTYDLFPSYPTIFNNKSSTRIKARAEHKDNKSRTNYRYINLTKNCPSPTTLNYGALRSGSWLLNYWYVSGGGCRSQVTTMEKY